MRTDGKGRSRRLFTPTCVMTFRAGFGSSLMSMCLSVLFPIMGVSNTLDFDLENGFLGVLKLHSRMTSKIQFSDSFPNGRQMDGKSHNRPRNCSGIRAWTNQHTHTRDAESTIAWQSPSKHKDQQQQQTLAQIQHTESNTNAVVGCHTRASRCPSPSPSPSPSPFRCNHNKQSTKPQQSCLIDARK